jgi:glycosyltransferase involved in cell wall biosynthesis
MERIKILIVVAGISIGDQNGGAEYFAVQLVRLLDKNLFEPLVFTMWRYGTPAEQHWLDVLAEEKIRVAGLTPARGPMLAQLRDIAIRIWKVTSDFSPDIINTHSQRGDIPNIFLHIFHRKHPCSIRTVHIDQPWLNRQLPDLLFDKIVFPLCFTKEIAISVRVLQKLDRRFLARLLKKRSVLCYNGIDAGLFTSESCPNYLASILSEKQPCIAVIGRLTKQKGHSFLLVALSQVLMQQPLHLLIIGSGSLETELRQQTKQIGLEEYVHFLGPRSDVIKILPYLDMLVSSSLWEGFPTILLEAMALGVPIVATDVSGSQELIENGITGLLVPPGSSRALADAILEMLSHPDRAKEMARKARESARSFTIQNATSQYANIYQYIYRQSK